MSRKPYALILLSFSLFLGLVSCTKSEKPSENKAAIKLDAKTCGKKKQKLNNAGNACVATCPQGQYHNAGTNSCMINTTTCDAGTELVVDPNGGREKCRKICPEYAPLAEEGRNRGKCICEDTEREPNQNGLCVDTLPTASCGPGTVLEGGICVVKCPDGSTVNDGGKCICEATGKQPNENGMCEVDPNACKDGEIKIGGVCKEATGANCQADGGKVLNSKKTACIASCPSNEDQNDKFECMPKKTDPTGSASAKRKKAFDEIPKGTDLRVELAVQQKFGTYTTQVERKIGGEDAYVTIKTLKVTYKTTAGDAEGTYYAKDGIFAKRSGWIFLSLQRKLSPAVSPHLFKLWVGCLDDKCETLGFKVKDLSPDAATENYTFQAVGKGDSYSPKTGN